MNEQPSDNTTSVTIAEELRAAIGWHQRGQLSQAQAIYEKILRIDPGHADTLHLLGWVAFQQKRFGAAVELIGRAIAAKPGNAAWYVHRAAALSQLNQLDAAIVDFTQAIALKPDYAEAYNNRGIALQRRKQLDAAIADFVKAIAVKPDYAEAYNNRGIALQHRKQLDAAMADYGTAIAINPNLAEAYNNRGLVLRELKRLDAAIADYDKAIAIRPDYIEAYSNRGLARQELKQFDAAMADYNRAIAVRPDYADAYNNRALAYRELKQFDAAMADHDKAIALKPDYAEAYNNRAVALQEQALLEAALADYGTAIALKPDYAEAYYNRGNVLQGLRRLDAAIADYATALALKPDYPKAHYNRGNALREQRKVAAAIADYDRAIALKPDYDEVYWNKALTLLLGGDLENGFKLYEQRWQYPHLNMEKRDFAQPLWLGDAPLRDKRILLHNEQGFGDTIQFCRYAPLLARAGAQVILGVPRPLVALLKSLGGGIQILAEGDPLPDFDYHCPLLSLPLAFKTVLDTVPDPTPYLHADPLQVRDWRERVGERKKPKVGVVWSGGFRTKAFEGWDAINERRNIRVDIFAQGLSGIDADFFSLQKGDPAEAEIRGREAEFWPRGNFRNFADDLKDFSDTAALVANLDLVVTVDTATAHLAAALGKPTWILNRFDNDWRWLLDRDDSPWYRSVRLYRQDESQSWEPVLQRVAADLTQLADEHRAHG